MKWHVFANGAYLGAIRCSLTELAQAVRIIKVYEYGNAVDVAPLSRRVSR